MNEKEFRDFLNEKGSVTDEDKLRILVEDVVSANPKAVEDYKKGKENSLQFILGQLMRSSGGKVDPSTALSLIKETIEKKG